jgi:hypothetical protein
VRDVGKPEVAVAAGLCAVQYETVPVAVVVEREPRVLGRKRPSMPWTLQSWLPSAWIANAEEGHPSVAA